MTITRILAAAGIASMALGGAALAQTNVSTQGGVEAAKDQMVRDAAAMEDEMKKDAMAKDDEMKKDAMAKDGEMMKDEMAKDAMAKEGEMKQ